MGIVVALATAALAAFGRAAVASEVDAEMPILAASPAPERSVVALATHWGGNTPFGYFGLALDVSPFRHPLFQRFSVEVGVNQITRPFEQGSATKGPPGWAVVPRVRLLSFSRVAFDVGAGVSQGSRYWTSADGSQHKEWDHAYRVDVQAGCDVGLRSDLHLRVYGGLGRMLSEPDVAYGVGPPPRDGSDVPYLGISLGYAPGRHINEPPPAGARWYGGQTLASDAAAILITALQPAPDSFAGNVIGIERGSAAHTAVLTGSAILFTAGAPIIHLEHRRPIAAGVSALMRLGVVALYLFAFEAIAREEQADFTASAAAGTAVAVVDAIFAWQRPTARPD